MVVATGYNHTPVMPDWPGREGFPGDLIHGQDYRNPEPYRDRDVLVVGSGNTGAEIAVDLVDGGAKRVRIAIRTPPHILLREVNGMPGIVVRDWDGNASVMSFAVDAGRIAEIDVVRNPDKLRGL